MLCTQIIVVAELQPTRSRNALMLWPGMSNPQHSMSTTTTMSWEDVAIVNQVDMDSSFAWALKIHHGENQLPSLVEASDASCSSSSESSYDDPLASDLSEMRISKVGAVKFSTVTVSEHAVTIGNHPGVDMYPISLDWPSVRNEPQSVDDYEAKRKPPVPCPPFKRCGIRAVRLSAAERMDRLAKVTGWTNDELFQHERKRQLTVQEEKRRAALGLPIFV
jgi:hypothetical protein